MAKAAKREVSDDRDEVEYHRPRASESGAAIAERALAATSELESATPSNTLEAVPGYRKPDLIAAAALPRGAVDAVSGSLAEQLMQEVLASGYARKMYTASLLVQEKLAGMDVTAGK